MNEKKNGLCLILMVIVCCILMAIVEIFIEPVYFLKSAIKFILFFIIPFIIMKKLNGIVFNNFKLDKRSIKKLLLLGIIIYGVIMIAYFITKNIFDYPKLIESLASDQHVTSNSFVWVALYISFINSFLEEFLFRLISFVKLSKYTKRVVAYLFSSMIFAIYHIAMIGEAFPPLLTILSIIGLTIGGCIFNFVDEKNDNIYNSWIIHMFADFAIMTIWFIYI